MIKRKKKILTMLLMNFVAVFLLVSLVGCSDDDGTKDSSTKVSTKAGKESSTKKDDDKTDATSGASEKDYKKTDATSGASEKDSGEHKDESEKKEDK